MHSEAHPIGSGNPSDLLPRLLRGAGAAVVVAALSLFLFQQWGSGDDVRRYLLLLSQTLVLAGSGFACVRWLRETKGARTFLALAVAAVPVNFTILGALFHSHWFGTGGALPEALAWQAADSTALLAAALISLPLLALISAFGFLVLARRSATTLTLLFLTVNALLLLPWRESAVIAGLVIASVGLLASGLRRLNRDSSLRTLEGRVARAVLFAAPLILIGRNLWLHNVGDFLLLAMAAGAFLVLRSASNTLSANAWRKRLEALSLLPAVAAGAAVGALVAVITSEPTLICAAATLTIALLSVEIGTRAAGGGAGYRLLAAVTAVGNSLQSLLLFAGPVAGFIALGVGLACIVLGYRARELPLLILGGIAALAGLGYELSGLVSYFDLGGWSGLAALGIGAIIGGSLLERHGPWLKSHGAIWASRFSQADA